MVRSRRRAPTTSEDDDGNDGDGEGDAVDVADGDEGLWRRTTRRSTTPTRLGGGRRSIALPAAQQTLTDSDEEHEQGHVQAEEDERVEIEEEEETPVQPVVQKRPRGRPRKYPPQQQQGGKGKIEQPAPATSGDDESQTEQPPTAPTSARKRRLTRRFDASDDELTMPPTSSAAAAASSSASSSSAAASFASSEEQVVSPIESLQQLSQYKTQLHKPPYTFGTLVDAAIRFSEHKRMTETEICDWLKENVGYFAVSNDDWQNAIYALLVSNPHFVRSVAPPSRNKGQGAPWCIVGLLPVGQTSPRRHSAYYQPNLPSYKKKDKLIGGEENESKSVFVHRHFDGTMEAYSRQFLEFMSLDLTDAEVEAEGLLIVPIDDRWKAEWNEPVQIPTRQLTTLPRAVVVDLEAQEASENRPVAPRQPYHLPSNYIPYEKETMAVHNDNVLYDLQPDDFELLSMLEQTCPPKDKINEDKLELILDHLEKAYGRKELSEIQAATPPSLALGSNDRLSDEPDEDDLTRCCICQENESEDTNELVFCDGCNAAVHQACYGIINVPDSRWFCASCSSHGEATKCILCPNRGGPMKKTDRGTWCHSACALWTPETSFDDVLRMEPIVQVESIPADRWRLSCALCHVHEGSCIQCAHPSCFVPFHVSCAIVHGCAMEIREKKGLVHKEVYCLKHSNNRGQAHQKPLLNAPAQTLAFKFDPKVISPESIQKKFSVSLATARGIVAYWVLQRKRRTGRPLIDDISVQAENYLQRISSVYHYRQFNCRAESFRPFAFLPLEDLKSKRWDVQTAHSLTRLLAERAHLRKKQFLLSKTMLDESLTALTAVLLRLQDAIGRMPSADIEARVAAADLDNMKTLDEWRVRIEKGEYVSLGEYVNDLRRVMRTTQPSLRLADKASQQIQATSNTLGVLANYRPRPLLKDPSGQPYSTESLLLVLVVTASKELAGAVADATSTLQKQLDQTKAQLVQAETNISKVTSEERIRERRQVVELRSLLAELEKTDKYMIFAEPVNVDIVPDYLKVIRHPMDFLTMRSKLERGEYDNDFQLLVTHFQLIVDNCLIYNDHGSDYHNEATNIRQLGKKIIKKFSKQHPELELVTNEEEVLPLSELLPQPPAPLDEPSPPPSPAPVIVKKKSPVKKEKSPSSAHKSFSRRPFVLEVANAVYTTDLAERAVAAHLSQPDWSKAANAPLHERLARLLHLLVLLDTNGFFLVPVELPEPLMSSYRETVASPMDLSTMTAKNDARGYRTVAQFKADLDLIVDNCIAFNSDDNVYAGEARKIRDKVGPLLDLMDDDVKKGKGKGAGSSTGVFVEKAAKDIGNLVEMLERYDWQSLFQGTPRRGEASRPDLGVIRWRLSNGYITAMPQFLAMTDVMYSHAQQQHKEGSEAHRHVARVQTSANMLFAAYAFIFDTPDGHEHARHRHVQDDAADIDVETVSPQQDRRRRKSVDVEPVAPSTDKKRKRSVDAEAGQRSSSSSSDVAVTPAKRTRSASIDHTATPVPFTPGTHSRKSTMETELKGLNMVDIIDTPRLARRLQFAGPKLVKRDVEDKKKKTKAHKEPEKTVTPSKRISKGFTSPQKPSSSSSSSSSSVVVYRNNKPLSPYMIKKYGPMGPPPKKSDLARNGGARAFIKSPTRPTFGTPLRITRQNPEPPIVRTASSLLAKKPKPSAASKAPLRRRAGF